MAKLRRRELRRWLFDWEQAKVYRAFRQTDILLGQIAAIFGAVQGGLRAATQWTAHALGYQPRRGTAWADVAGLPVDEPWKLFE